MKERLQAIFRTNWKRLKEEHHEKQHAIKVQLVPSFSFTICPIPAQDCHILGAFGNFGSIVWLSLHVELLGAFDTCVPVGSPWLQKLEIWSWKSQIAVQIWTSLQFSWCIRWKIDNFANFVVWISFFNLNFRDPKPGIDICCNTFVARGVCSMPWERGV